MEIREDFFPGGTRAELGLCFSTVGTKATSRTWASHALGCQLGCAGNKGEEGGLGRLQGKTGFQPMAIMIREKAFQFFKHFHKKLSNLSSNKI
jgi:hypothetical protein